MLKNGFICLSRSITDWKWYKNGNTFRLFIHLLLTANYEDHEFEDIIVHRGQRVTSRATLAEETGLTESQVRTAMEHLVSTNEIAFRRMQNCLIITLNNYDTLISFANGSQANRKTVAIQSQQCNKDNNKNKDNNFSASENTLSGSAAKPALRDDKCKKNISRIPDDENTADIPDDEYKIVPKHMDPSVYQSLVYNY